MGEFKILTLLFCRKFQTGQQIKLIIRLTSILSTNPYGSISQPYLFYVISIHDCYLYWLKNLFQCSAIISWFCFMDIELHCKYR